VRRSDVRPVVGTDEAPVRGAREHRLPEAFANDTILDGRLDGAKEVVLLDCSGRQEVVGLDEANRKDDAG
jgi:hypothetical protein